MLNAALYSPSFIFSKLLARNPDFQQPTLPFGLANDRVTRLWLMSGLFLMGFLVVLCCASYFDPRALNGAPIWAKPIKFCLSLAIHFFTLTILAQLLSAKQRNTIGLSIIAYAATASMLFEQIYISIQAARGRHSHFNLETGIESLLYGVMGIGAVLLILAALVVGVMIWNNSRLAAQSSPDNSDKNNLTQASTGLRLGAIIGLIAGAILTGLFAGYMSAGTSHLIGSTVSDANGLPLVGWSRVVGDLRVPHFLATHLMQLLPLTGWLCDRYKLPARSLVIIVSISLILLSGVLFWQALLGVPVFTG